MLRIFTILLAVGILSTASAQDVPIRYWNFDGSDSEFAGAIRGERANIADGVEKFGVYLNGNSNTFVPYGVEWTDDFTVSFWFKPTTVDKPQTIFLLEKITNKTNQTERYIHLFLQDKKLFLKDEKNYLAITEKTVSEGEWYHVTYQYDGFEARIYWAGAEVFSSGKVTMYNQLAQRKDVLTIGKGSNGIGFLEAVLDEVRIYNRPIETTQIVEEFKVEQPVVKVEKPIEKSVKPIEKVVEKPIVEAPKEPFRVKKKIKDEFKKATFSGRENDIQHEIYVTQTNIEVEVWDYDEFDNDRISVTLNNSPFIGTCCKNKLVQKKRKKTTYRFNLVTEAVNYLTFVAEDMGIYDSQNTAAARIIVNGERFDDIYKLVLTKKKNAVLKFVHVPLNKNKSKIVPAVATKNKDLDKIIVENKVLDPLVVNSTTVTLRVRGKEKNRRKVSLALEDKSLAAPFFVSKELSRNLVFNLSTQTEKILLLEALNLKQTQKSRIILDVEVNGQVVKTYQIALDEANTLLPFVYVPDKKSKDPRNQRTVVVTDTNLTIQIRDFSKVDGDQVTIKQEGKVILANYVLTGDFKDLPITLKANSDNKFVFVPVSMGRSKGENTAYVMILSKGEVIHEFSLRSQDKNKPAKLTIVHREN
ncbi:MAG: LamG domain-containing protein [Saprospiraceae bacterium]